MQLHHLKYFISVAEHLNFTEAAKELFVAQSAVSQQIACLETDLGVKLFERNKRSVQLTNAGDVFLKEALEIVKKSEEAVEMARKADAGLIGSINIGFLAAPVRRFLPELIGKFTRLYPNIEIKLNHFNLGELNENLKKDDIDIVFAISMGFQDIDHLECIHLSNVSSCVFLHHQHPLANKSSLDLADLAAEPFVFRERAEAPQWYDYTLALCAKSGFSPTIISHSKRIETVLMFVEAQLGIAIFPRYLEMYASPMIKMITIAGEENILNVVAYHKLTNKNPAIPIFLDQLYSLKQQFENDRYDFQSLL